MVEYQQELNEIYTKNLSLSKNVSIDPSKRKATIMATSKNVLNAQNVPNTDTFTIKSTKITTDISMNEIANIILKFGKIIDIAPPSPPAIEIISESINSVKIRIDSATEEIIKHKIEYVQTDNTADSKLDEDDEQKLNWISKETKQAKLMIDSLAPNKVYLISASSLNAIGWSQYSEIVTFRTKGNLNDRFGYYRQNCYWPVNETTISRCGQYGVCYGAAVIPSTAGGVYQWVFKILSRLGNMGIGIDETKYKRIDGSLSQSFTQTKSYVLWHNGCRNRWDTNKMIAP